MQSTVPGEEMEDDKEDFKMVACFVRTQDSESKTAKRNTMLRQQDLRKTDSTMLRLDLTVTTIFKPASVEFPL
eukprot:902843-Amphidinium_carterae.1